MLNSSSNFRRVSHGHGSAPNSPILSFVSLKSTPRSRALPNIESDGWSHAHSGHAEINDEVDHAVILASIGTHGDCHHIHRHCAIVETKAACCQAITIAVHQNIAWAHAGHPQFASVEVRPIINILFCREDGHALTRCAARRMHLQGSTWPARFHKRHPIGIGSTYRFLLEEW